MKKETDSNLTWKNIFLFTKDGKLQSTDLMYSFFLGIGLLFLHFLIANRLTILIEKLFPEMSRSGKNALGIIIPAVICAVFTILPFRLIRKKRIVVMAYCLILLLVLVIFVILLFEFDSETREFLTAPYIAIFMIPAAAGTAAVMLLYRKWLRNNPDPLAEAEKASEKELPAEEPLPEDQEPDFSGWKQFR